MFESSVVAQGWLRKDCRFGGIMHHLKLRYFVLLNTRLTYYKHPKDTDPAGMIELEEISDVQVYPTTTTHLYGFKLIFKESHHHHHWIPVLYANSEEERRYWIQEIRENINHKKEEEYSVLDKWLYRLNLYDGISRSTIKSFEDDSSSTSESSTFYSSSRHSSTSLPHLHKHSGKPPKRHYTAPPSLSSGHQKVLESSLESEQRKYKEMTSYYCQHPHQHHSFKHSSI